MSAGWRYSSASRTDQGLVRAQNEDSLVDRAEHGIWAVADGIGGHEGGQRSSTLIRGVLEAEPAVVDPEADLVRVSKGLQSVHAQLRSESRFGPRGSTVVVLLAAGPHFACTWVGDSRLYRWRAGRLESLTQDHSLVAELVASGTLTPEAARGHPLATRITRAVGVGSEQLETETMAGDFAPGDRYLLSSDGLHGVLSEALIAKLIALPDLENAVDGMIAAVKRAGAPDNVTVVLVAAEPEESG